MPFKQSKSNIRRIYLECILLSNAKAKKTEDCFSGHFLKKKTDEAGRFFLYFFLISPKTDEAILFLFFLNKIE